MYVSKFQKHWDKMHGYTMEEATDKKQKVDEAHDVGKPDSKWRPAEIKPDKDKPNGGYMVVICTKA